MDYSYSNSPLHPHFMGSTSNTLNDANTVPGIFGTEADMEPNFLSVPYNMFHPFNGLPTSTHGAFQSTTVANSMGAGSVDSGIGVEGEDIDGNGTRSSSEEKEIQNTNLAQTRRKAQNRAAQRAFRERKERHVRDLEAKLSALESSTHSVQSDNDRLKLILQRVRTENEVLHATTGGSLLSSRPISASYPSLGAHPCTVDADNAYNVQVLSNGTVVNKADKTHIASRTKPKSREIPAAQVWDLIQSHPLVKQGIVDIADVCERLKGAARCNGNGPVFEETLVWAAVESCRGSSSDELI